MIQKCHTRILVIAFLFSGMTIYSQNESFNYENEISQRAPVPDAPEAAAFGSFGDVGVNMYTGTPAIGVPIYTHKGRELDLPINLSYDASGIKVNQLPTLAGLGWNLNVGGMITRQVNGKPDDYLNANALGAPYQSWYENEVFSKMNTYKADAYRFTEGNGGTKVYQDEPEAKEYLAFLRSMHEGEYDTQPDYYTINAMGLSETFVLKVSNKNAFSLNNPNTIITYSGVVNDTDQGGITQFNITTDNGTKMKFSAIEETTIDKSNDTQASTYGLRVTYRSAWYLTEVTSPHGKDIYTFEYDAHLGRTDDYTSPVSEATNILYQDVTKRVTKPITASTSYSHHNRKALSSIRHNGKEIVNINSAIISNGPDAGFTNLKIYNSANATSGVGQDVSKTYTFNHDYFMSESNLDVSLAANRDKVRLMLESIDIKDAQNSIEQSYSFEYNLPHEIAPLGSFSQDYLGYYNGASNNNLFPALSGDPDAYPTSYNEPIATSSGGNRSPSFIYAKKGLLTKMTYPTGGHTLFEFEGAHINKIEYDSQQTPVERANRSNSSSTWPTVNNNLCNANNVGGSVYSPKVQSQVFSTPYDIGDEITNNNFITYTRTGSNSIQGIHYIPIHAILVKLADVNSPYTWGDIYNSNCELLIDPADVVWSHQNVGDTTTNVYLEDNTAYQVFLPLFDIGYTKAITIEGFNSIPLVTTTALPRAGLRVKNITDYSKSGIIAKKKQYEYTPIQLSNPIFAYYTSERYQLDQVSSSGGSTNAEINNYEVLHRLSQPIYQDKPHIGYSSVVESYVDTNDPTNNITKVHKFKRPETAGMGTVFATGNYVTKNGVNLFSATHYSRDPSVGASIGSVTDNTNISISYNDKKPTSDEKTWGLYLDVVGRNNDLYPVIQPVGGQYKIMMIPGVPKTVIGDFNEVPVTPPANPNGTCFGTVDCLPEIARLSIQKAYAYAYNGGEIEHQVTIVDDVETSTSYTYTSDIDRRYLKSTSVDVGIGDALKTIYQYPHELPVEYGGLVAKNMLSQPVIIEGFENDALLTTAKTKYNSQEFPEEILTAKGDENLESRMVFEQYLNGNLTQARQVDGRPVSFIWGYDDRYVVAKIQNIEYNDLPSTLVNQIRSTTNEVQLLGYLNTLQSTLSGNKMSLYTYRPNIGVSTMIDASSYSMKYHYDEFQRLKRVEDQDGKVLSENEYNYKN